MYCARIAIAFAIAISVTSPIAVAVAVTSSIAATVAVTITITVASRDKGCVGSVVTADNDLTASLNLADNHALGNALENGTTRNTSNVDVNESDILKPASKVSGELTRLRAPAVANDRGHARCRAGKQSPSSMLHAVDDRVKGHQALVEHARLVSLDDISLFVVSSSAAILALGHAGAEVLGKLVDGTNGLG